MPSRRAGPTDGTKMLILRRSVGDELLRGGEFGPTSSGPRHRVVSTELTGSQPVTASVQSSYVAGRAGSTDCLFTDRPGDLLKNE